MAENSEQRVRRDEGPIAELSDEERFDLLEYHPIREREYTLPTPMMKRAYALIRDRVWARRTGAVFYASPRTGKTKCLVATKELLGQEFPRCFVSLLSARRSTRTSDAHMFRLILEAECHALSGRDNADALFNNAVSDIEMKTRSKGATQFILLIDEAQLLNEFDFQQLVCFHNALDLKKIRMTTISFAQPEIGHRRTALLASHDRQIIARFLSELVLYEGCTGSDDLRLILRSYDIASEFPEGSGWSYTRFFVPIAFSHGFLLERYAVRLWSELARAAGIGGNGMIPMEHTCLAIEFLLLDLRTQDSTSLTLNDANIANAVLSSQLALFSACMDEEA